MAASLALAAAVHAAVAFSGGAQAAATAISSDAVIRGGIVSQAGQWLLKRAMYLLPSGETFTAESLRSCPFLVHPVYMHGIFWVDKIGLHTSKLFATWA